MVYREWFVLSFKSEVGGRGLGSRFLTLDTGSWFLTLGSWFTNQNRLFLILLKNSGVTPMYEAICLSGKWSISVG